MPARRLPPLRALEAFMRTVRLGSARAAAEEIGLSPSALSRRISNLEEFVGKKLFTRARQSMQLTDEGQAFYEAVNPHMEALARAVESQSDNIALLRLRLGVLPMFGSQRLFPRPQLGGEVGPHVYPREFVRPRHRRVEQDLWFGELVEETTTDPALDSDEGMTLSLDTPVELTEFTSDLMNPDGAPTLGETPNE